MSADAAAAAPAVEKRERRERPPRAVAPEGQTLEQHKRQFVRQLGRWGVTNEQFVKAYNASVGEDATFTVKDMNAHINANENNKKIADGLEKVMTDRKLKTKIQKKLVNPEDAALVQRVRALEASLRQISTLLAASLGEDQKKKQKKDKKKKERPVPKSEAPIHMYQAGAAFTIDVRDAEEFAAGHLKKARNIPHTEIAESKKIPRNKARMIIVHCGTGARAAKALETLTGMGHTNVVNAGGYKDIANWDE